MEKRQVHKTSIKDATGIFFKKWVTDDMIWQYHILKKKKHITEFEDLVNTVLKDIVTSDPITTKYRIEKVSE